MSHTSPLLIKEATKHLLGAPSSLLSSRTVSGEGPGTQRKARTHSGNPRASKRGARTRLPKQAGEADASGKAEQAQPRVFRSPPGAE